MRIKTGIGQDSHRFGDDMGKPLMLAGVHFPSYAGLAGNSDADVVLHAVTNAISGVTGVNIIGKASDKMCIEDGIDDSAVYLEESLKYLGDFRLTHLSISIECKKPMITPMIDAMKKRLAEIIPLQPEDICITATTGEGLTDFGRGDGIQTFAVVTAIAE